MGKCDILQKMNTSIVDVQAIFEAFLTDNGIAAPDVILDEPADDKFGDIATSVALKYAKQLKKKPMELAQIMCDYLVAQNLLAVASVSVAEPGFINLVLTPSSYSDLLESILSAETTFGANTELENQKWVIEHTSPNPNKAMHLGHLRNNLVGMSLVRLLTFSGATVISDAIDNNRGIAIAKMMWGFLAHMKKSDSVPSDAQYWVNHPGEWFTPEEKRILPDIYVTQCYILGETDFKSNPDFEKVVRSFVVGWEAGDTVMWQLWSHMLSFAYAGMERTLTRLGNHWDKVWHEHEHYKSGKDFVEKGVTRGLFTVLDDGAVLTNLASYNIPDTILLKNDGTSLYITQDIALTALKKEFYHADKLVWVIGPEQSLVMKQLFATCEQLGIGAVADFSHVTYGYVGLRDESGSFKKMSSRAGTVVLIDDVLDAVKEKIQSRSNDEVTSEFLDEKLALAAVKFSILKTDRKQDLVFDPDQSITTTGDSGIYVMYAYTRAKSILRKKCRSSNFVPPQELGSEINILRKLLYFPVVIKRSQVDLSVHHICQYLLELSSAFNSWYAKEIVIDGSERENYKLAVTEAVAETIKNGLAILGIDVIESM